VVELALYKRAINHPAVIESLLLGIWSLNEKASGREGLELPRPSLDFMDDLADISEIQARK
jgi:hypothetical protein